MDPQTMLYLYGVVAAGAEPPGAALVGVDGAAVSVVRAGALAGVVSAVAAESYSEEALTRQTADLGWVGERGVAHERVLTWFADLGPIVPLRPFSLHRDEARVRERLAEGADAFARALERLRGRREWIVRLWRLPQAAEHVAAHSRPLRALLDELDGASAGRRFLLEKKRVALQHEELRATSAARARAAFQALEPLARSAVPVPVAAAAGDRALVMQGAFLVDDERYADFQRGVTHVAHDAAAAGFEVEFTGPWPPYHFAGTDDA